jgi:hypothetical protein
VHVVTHEGKEYKTDGRDSIPGIFPVILCILWHFAFHDQRSAVPAGLAAVDLAKVTSRDLVDIPAPAVGTAQHTFNTYMWSMEK